MARFPRTTRSRAVLLLASATLALVLACLALGCGMRTPPGTSGTHTTAPGGDAFWAAQLETLAARLPACRGVVLRDVFTGRVPRECITAARALVAACGTADLEAMARADSIREPCKQALYDLLPPELDSLRSGLFVLGVAARERGRIELVIAITGEDRAPLRTWTPETLRVHLALGAERVPVAGPVSAGRLVDRSGLLVSMSSVLDYSGSMSDADVDESIAIFQNLYTALPEPKLESDVVLFSTEVYRKHGFSTSQEQLRARVSRDPTIPRKTTALVDAMGVALEELGARSAPVRLLVVATDGKENASSRYTPEDVLDKAARHGVRIVSFGSLFSDVAFMEQMAARTGGLFVYRPRPADLAKAARAVRDALEHAWVVEAQDPRLEGADGILVEHAGRRTLVPLRSGVTMGL